MGTIAREGSDELSGGEINTLPGHLIGTSESQSTNNLDPRSAVGAITRNGRSQFGVDNGSGNAVKGLKSWTRDNGTTFLIARLGTTFYDVSAASWASIGVGGTNNSRFRARPLNERMVIAVDGIAPRKWDGTTFAVLGGSPPSNSRFVELFQSKIFLAGDSANPQTLTFSASNDPEDYTTASGGGSINTQDGGGDTIQGLVSNRKVLCIMYRNYTDILIGDSVFNFRVERLIDRGLVSDTGYVSAGEVCFFASDEAVYMVAGSKVTDLTTLKFRETYKAISDKSKITLGVKGDLLLVNDYGNSKGYACAYKYNRWATWGGQTWEVMDTANDQTLYAGISASTTQIWKLDSGSLDGSSTLACAWQTPNLAFGWPDAIKNLVAIKVHAKPGIGTVTVVYQKDGAEVGSQTDLSFSSTGTHDWSGRHAQSAVRGNYISLTFKWSGVGTLYGWAAYAEITSEAGQVPVE